MDPWGIIAAIILVLILVLTILIATHVGAL